MQNWDVTLKGHFDVPIEDHNTGEILLNFTCIIEADSPWSAAADATDCLSESFNKDVGYTSPVIAEVHVVPHYE